MIRMTQRLFFLGLLLIAALSLRAAEPGSEVVVVYNRNLPESKQLAEYYAARRLVPAGQLFGVDVNAASEVMTRNVITCDPDDSIDHIMETMTRGRFRHLPVVRHGELLGLVSIGDVVKARLKETTHETEALRAYIVAG